MWFYAPMRGGFLRSMLLSHAAGAACLIGLAIRGSTLPLPRRRLSTASRSRPVTCRISSRLVYLSSIPLPRGRVGGSRGSPPAPYRRPVLPRNSIHYARERRVLVEPSSHRGKVRPAEIGDDGHQPEDGKTEQKTREKTSLVLGNVRPPLRIPHARGKQREADQDHKEGNDQKVGHRALPSNLARDRQRRDELAPKPLGAQLGRELVGDMPGKNDGAVGLVVEQVAFLDHRDGGTRYRLADLERARHLA